MNDHGISRDDAPVHRAGPEPASGNETPGSPRCAAVPSCSTATSPSVPPTAACSAPSSSISAAASTAASTSPAIPTADAHGFRQDVMALVRELGPPSCATPAATSSPATTGKTASGRWRSAHARLDYAWFSTEPNSFGTNEFIDWCRARRHRADAGGQPRHPRPAGCRLFRRILQFSRAAPRYSDLRRQHGWEKPHGMKFWCLGNEMDGPWQTGAKTAEEYGRLAAEAAKIMKWVDSSHRAGRLRLVGAQHGHLRGLGADGP